MFRYALLAVFAVAAIPKVQGSNNEIINILDRWIANSKTTTEQSETSSHSIDCSEDQWRCYDGTCISFDKRCDGVIDCTDGSDERHAVCRENICLPNLFRCTYGACVDGDARCNGTPECADSSDELLPKCRNETTVVDGMFTCNNGAHISASDLCDGAKNCLDGSDEILEACAGLRCPSYLFQCAYGACVDAAAKCDANGVWDCADGSDEFDDLCGRTSPPEVTTPRNNDFICDDGMVIPLWNRCDAVAHCQDGSDEAQCSRPECEAHQFQCAGDGVCVSADAKCNGIVDCTDGSDELEKLCNRFMICDDGMVIPTFQRCDGFAHCQDGSDEAQCSRPECEAHQFQCAGDGVCVRAGAKCNGILDCSDGSDELENLCNRSTTPPNPINRPEQCQTPPAPANGAVDTLKSMKWLNIAHQNRTETEEYLEVSVSCLPPYRPEGDVLIACHNGVWNGTVAECKLSCKVYSHHSVTYFCIDAASGETKECDNYVADGTTILPQCNVNYHFDGDLLQMTCLNNEWNYIATCEPDPKVCDTTSDAVEVYGKGKNLTITINDSIFVKVSGPDYTVVVANASDTFISYDVPSIYRKSAVEDNIVMAADVNQLDRVHKFRSIEKTYGDDEIDESPVVRKKFDVPRVIIV